MNASRAVVGIVGVSVLIGVVLAAQTPAPPQAPASQTSPLAFRGGTTVVPIDVHVVDRAGRPVTDLRKDEFVVYENDVRQRISLFETRLLTAGQPPPGRSLIREDPSDEVKAQSQRVFLLIMGGGRLQHPTRSVDAVLQFVRDRLLPQDQVAVLAWNRATDFTTDHAQVAAVLERFRARHEWVDRLRVDYFSGLTGMFAGPEMPSFLQKEIDWVFTSPGPNGLRVRELPPGKVADSARLEQYGRRLTGQLQGIPVADDRSDAYQRSRLGTTLDEYVARDSQAMSDLANLYTGIDYLRFIDGEKHVIFFTADGLGLRQREDAESVAALASDARVIVDAVVGGTPSAFPGGSSAGTSGRFPNLSLRDLAQMTGGQWSLATMASPTLARIDATTRSGYLLGYTPTDTRADGRYRRISVRVTRPGLTVLSRQGYFANGETTPLGKKALRSYARVMSAANFQGDVHDLKVGVTALYPVSAPKTGGDVMVTLSIAPTGVTLEEAAGVRVGSLKLAIFCGDAKERMIGQLWQTLDLNLRDQSYEGFLGTGLVYRFSVPVTAKPTYVKAIVYDYAGDHTGSVSVKMQ